MKKILSLLALLFSVCLISCDSSSSTDVDIDVDEPNELPTGEAVLSVSRSRIYNDGADEAVLTVMCGDVDVTEYSKIYQVGTYTTMESNIFTSTENGKYEFYANYSNINTNTVSLAVGNSAPDCPSDPDASNTLFEGRMLMLQFTGTECSYCQYMIPAVEDILADATFGNMIEQVAIHSYYGYGADPMYSVASAQFSQAMGIAYYPTVMFNMDDNILTYNTGTSSSSNYDALYTLITKNYDSTPSVGISAANSIENGTLTANVEVKAAEDGEYSVGMFLLESGIPASQTGLGDMDHDNTFRTSADRVSTYNFSGTSVGEVAVGETASVILDMAIDENAWDLDKCHLLIYVTATNDNGDYIVQNVVRCEVEGEVAYQYAE
ncbi:MAG: Omp28-related outer membrane protein [Rikenellaceae bacterium]